MKYNLEQGVQEVLRRSEVIAEKRQQRRLRTLSGSTLSLTALLAVSVLSLNGGAGGIRAMLSPYGSFLLAAETGGYVLTGVVAFTLGVMAAVLCVKHKKPDSKSSGEDHNENSEVTL